MGTLIQGWALAEQGQGEAGIAQIRQGVAALRAAGMRFLGTYHLTLLAEAYDAVGEPEAGLRVLAEALAQVEQTDGSPRASTRSICSRQKRCSKSFQRKAENLITSPIIERACKAFSDENSSYERLSVVADERYRTLCRISRQ